MVHVVIVRRVRELDDLRPSPTAILPSAAHLDRIVARRDHAVGLVPGCRQDQLVGDLRRQAVPAQRQRMRPREERPWPCRLSAPGCPCFSANAAYLHPAPPGSFSTSLPRPSAPGARIAANSSRAAARIPGPEGAAGAGHAVASIRRGSGWSVSATRIGRSICTGPGLPGQRDPDRLVDHHVHRAVLRP